MNTTDSVFDIDCINSVDEDNNRSVYFHIYHEGECLGDLSLKDMRLLQIFIGDVIANEELYSEKRKGGEK